jgi:cytochrome c peroxidase
VSSIRKGARAGRQGFKPQRRLTIVSLSICAASALLMAGCNSGFAPAAPASEATTPAADSIGERIFIDPRFSEYFAAHMTGTNDPLTTGDPVLNTVNTTSGTLPGPFAGQSMNCRSCHFVTEFEGVKGGGNRTYSDFTLQSPLPIAMNGFTHTPRNSMQMVDSFTPRSTPTFLHFDGEFASGEDLVVGTMTGRNFGWTPAQYNDAIAHIARIVREDDGTSQLAIDRTDGLSYATLFLGTDPRITSDILLPANLRIDVNTATDAQVVHELAICVTQYMKDLLYQRDEYSHYIGTPYDNFLRVNHLPQQVLAGETRAAYNQRLYQAVLALSNPIYITTANGSFKYHANPYQFGATELAGLKIFLKAGTAGGGDGQHAGNCAACHQAPDFTDFGFHTTGVTQRQYDNIHGSGAFVRLYVPSLTERNNGFDLYLPASPTHPNAQETFRRVASASNPNYADLGLWNIYLNPDIPNPQANLKSFVCAAGKDCSVDNGLASTIAQFKTPILRDLEDSAPYFHDGSAITFNDVIEFYIANSKLAQSGALRNAPAEFNNMSLSEADVAALVAFLQSLTEDYDDA